jgi:hypothetical protein
METLWPFVALACTGFEAASEKISARAFLVFRAAEL